MNIHNLEECVMLDTVGFNVHDVNAELPTTVDVNGRRSRSVGRLFSPSGRRAVKLHHVKAHNELRVEGSAAQLFQDHNIVASNDLRMTVISLLKAIKDTHDVHIPLHQAYQIFLGQGVAMTRVDTPAMLRLPSGITPAAAVNGIALAGLRCGLNVTLHRDESFYFDQHSQTEAIKGYRKDVQMAHQKKKAALSDTENASALRELSASTLRIEMVYRKKHFNGLTQFGGSLPSFSDLSPRVLAEMFARQLEKYNPRGRLRAFANADELFAIPRNHRAVVMLWQHGHDLLKHFDGKQQALNRVRNLLLQNHSIDINEMPPGEIELPVQVGEILRAENFVRVPDVIRRDPALFHVFDVHKEWRSICERRGLGNNPISRTFVDIYEAADAPVVTQLMDFPIN
jgi:hypothetical protein